MRRAEVAQKRRRFAAGASPAPPPAAATCRLPASPESSDDLTLAFARLLPAPQQQAHLLLAPDQGCRAARGTPRTGSRPRRVQGRGTPGPARGSPWPRTGPRSRQSNRPPTSRRVVSAMTTLFGSAIACSLAARFGVSPTTAYSWAAPRPSRSPTTASPVAMPTRIPSAVPAGVSRLWAEAVKLERRANRALGVVFVRARVAEIGQDAVAHVLGNKAARRVRRRPSTRTVVGADQLTKVLGIEAGGEGRRADQVDEHHRELPPLRPRRRGSARPGILRSRFGDRPRCRWACQAANGMKHDLARPKRQPEFSQVGLGQRPQNLGRDLGVEERLRVAFHSQIAQPGGNFEILPRHERSSLPTCELT